MEGRHEDLLREQYKRLKGSLHPGTDILDSLYTDSIISVTDKNKIAGLQDSCAQSEALLELLPKLGRNAFNAFFRALSWSKLDSHKQLARGLLHHPSVTTADKAGVNHCYAERQGHSDVLVRCTPNEGHRSYNSGHIDSRFQHHPSSCWRPGFESLTSVSSNGDPEVSEDGRYSSGNHHPRKTSPCARGNGVNVSNVAERGSSSAKFNALQSAPSKPAKFQRKESCGFQPNPNNGPPPQAARRSIQEEGGQNGHGRKTAETLPGSILSQDTQPPAVTNQLISPPANRPESVQAPVVSPGQLSSPLQKHIPSFKDPRSAYGYPEQHGLHTAAPVYVRTVSHQPSLTPVSRGEESSDLFSGQVQETRQTSSRTRAAKPSRSSKTAPQYSHHNSQRTAGSGRRPGQLHCPIKPASHHTVPIRLDVPLELCFSYSVRPQPLPSPTVRDGHESTPLVHHSPTAACAPSTASPLNTTPAGNAPWQGRPRTVRHPSPRHQPPERSPSHRVKFRWSCVTGCIFRQSPGVAKNRIDNELQGKGFRYECFKILKYSRLPSNADKDFRTADSFLEDLLQETLGVAVVALVNVNEDDSRFSVVRDELMGALMRVTDRAVVLSDPCTQHPDVVEEGAHGTEECDGPGAESWTGTSGDMEFNEDVEEECVGTSEDPTMGDTNGEDECDGTETETWYGRSGGQQFAHQLEDTGVERDHDSSKSTLKSLTGKILVDYDYLHLDCDSLLRLKAGMRAHKIALCNFELQYKKYVSNKSQSSETDETDEEDEEDEEDDDAGGRCMPVAALLDIPESHQDYQMVKSEVENALRIFVGPHRYVVQGEGASPYTRQGERRRINYEQTSSGNRAVATTSLSYPPTLPQATAAGTPGSMSRQTSFEASRDASHANSVSSQCFLGSSLLEEVLPSVNIVSVSPSASASSNTVSLSQERPLAVDADSSQPPEQPAWNPECQYSEEKAAVSNSDHTAPSIATMTSPYKDGDCSSTGSSCSRVIATESEPSAGSPVLSPRPISHTASAGPPVVVPLTTAQQPHTVAVGASKDTDRTRVLLDSGFMQSPENSPIERPTKAIKCTDDPVLLQSPRPATHQFPRDSPTFPVAKPVVIPVAIPISTDSTQYGRHAHPSSLVAPRSTTSTVAMPPTPKKNTSATVSASRLPSASGESQPTTTVVSRNPSEEEDQAVFGSLISQNSVASSISNDSGLTSSGGSSGKPNASLSRFDRASSFFKRQFAGNGHQ